METTIIKNGIIVTENKEYASDILIENGRIKKIAKKIDVSGIKKIDASGCFVIPGAIDVHVHLQLPTPAGNSCDDFESGSIAAIAGGTTCFIDFVTPAPGQDLIEAFKKRKKEAQKSLLDYGLHMSITGWDNNTEKEIIQCIRKEGITSFKIYLAYKGVIGVNDDVIVKAMGLIAKNKGLVTAHCENGDMIKFLQDSFIKEGKTKPLYHALSRPSEAEAEAVNRVVALAGILHCPLYIVHVSTAAAMKIIQTAKNKGQTVYAETCPHYLLLTEEKYSGPAREAISYVLSPPLRTKKDQAHLWKSIQKGEINVLASDHCPFNNKGQKDIGIDNFTKIPNGGNGLEERLSLLWHFGVGSKKISPSQFVKLTSTEPAKIFGLYPKKGVIEVGADADIVLWNPHKKKNISSKTHNQKCDTNIYEGMSVHGAPEIVLVKGIVAWENNQLATRKIKGEYLFRS